MTLIQQRMALDRDVFRARWSTVLFFVLAALGLAYFFTETYQWFAGVMCLGWLGVGVVNAFALRRALRKRRAFDLEHGPDAGKQASIR